MSKSIITASQISGSLVGTGSFAQIKSVSGGNIGPSFSFSPAGSLTIQSHGLLNWDGDKFFITAKAGKKLQLGSFNTQGVLTISSSHADTMVISGSNVGIGTSSPVQKLHIEGNIVRLDKVGNDGGYYLYDSSNNFRYAIFDNNSQTQIYADGNGTNPYIVMDSNKLGIGTTSLGDDKLLVAGNTGITGSLHVSGNITTSGSIIAKEFRTEFVNQIIATSSGSTTFGDSIDDVHHFTGSMRVSSSIRVPDGATIQAGEAGDVAMFHNGSNSFLSNSTGLLIIEQNANDTDFYIKVTDGGSQITALQIDASEVGRVKLPNDNQRLTIGASDDMQLSHESNNNYIATYAGNLILEQNTNDADIIFNCDDGSGGVTAYFTADGSEVRNILHEDTHLLASKKLAVGNATPSYSLSIVSPTTAYGLGDAPGAHLESATDHRLLFKVKNTNTNTGASAPRAGFDLEVQNHKNDTVLRAILDLKQMTAAGGGGETSLTVPQHFSVLVNNSASLFETSGALESDSTPGGTEAFRVGTTGNIGINATNKLYFDGVNGAGHTYISETAGDRLDFYAGGDLMLRLSEGGTDTVHIMDNVQFHLGSGNDIKIYHDGSNSSIENHTGGLFIDQNTNNGDITFRNDDGSGGLTSYLIIDGNAERIQFSKKALIDDNVKFEFGSGADLQVYHNGTNSYINNTTGDLHISQSASDKDILISVNDGGTKLEALKIDASSGGDLVLPNDEQNFHMGAGNDLSIYVSSDDVYIKNQTSDKDIRFLVNDGGSTITALKIDSSVVGSLYMPNDNQYLGIGAGNDLRFWHDGTNSNIYNYVGELRIGNTTNDSDIILYADDQSGGNAEYVKLDGSTGDLLLTPPSGKISGSITSTGSFGDIRLGNPTGHSKILSDDSLVLGAKSVVSVNIDYDANQSDRAFVVRKDSDLANGGTELFRVTEAGNVGVGTDSPGEKLTIKAAGTTAQELIKIRDSGNTEKFVIGLQATTGNPTISTNDGDLYVDATHDINLDAAGGQIFFTQAGTAVGQIDMAGTDLEIKSLVSNASFTLRGNDGGSEIDAIAINMAAAGTTTFNHDIFLNKELSAIRFGASQQGSIYEHASDIVISNSAAGNDTIFENLNSAGDTYVKNLFIDGSTSRIGIGTTTPGTKLEVIGSISGSLTSTGSFGALVIDPLHKGFTIGNHSGKARLIYNAGYFQFTDADNSYGSIAAESGSFYGDVGIRATKKLYFDDGEPPVAGNTYISETSNGILRLQVDGENMLELSSAGSDPRISYFNKDNRDRDFSFCGDTNDGALYFDASAERVGINTSSPSSDLHINTTDDGSVTFTRDGGHKYSLEHDASQLYLYNRTLNKNQIMFSHSGPVTINNDGHSTIDFRVEGDSNANLLFTDASTDRVGIGTSSPGNLFTVLGTGTHQASIAYDASTRLQISVEDSGKARLFTDNNALIGLEEGAYIQPTKKLFLDGGLDTYLQEESANVVGFYTGGARRAKLSTSRFEVSSSMSIKDTLYIAHGGSDYSPAISFMGGTDTAGVNDYENATIGYYDNSGTGNMLFKGNRGAMNWHFNDDGDSLFLMASSGDFHADGDVIAASTTTSSDIRLKKNINDIPYGLGEVLQLRGVEFDWKEKRDGKHDIGVIAQEIEKIIPEVVQESKDLNSDTMYKSVDYGKLTAILIKAVQEQQEQIKELKEDINKLRGDD